MKAIIPVFYSNDTRPLYLQLYDYIKKEILAKEIVPGEKLPSLRNLSVALKISLTTVEMAYSQLAVEGYIYSKPQSGYFVGEMFYPGQGVDEIQSNDSSFKEALPMKEPDLKYDLSCFDFTKWKKCLSKVLNEYPQMLLFESEIRGEKALQTEISKYVYQSRGVKCNPHQIVIAAGTQQITSLLTNILGKIGIAHVAVEDPGYLPVNNIFRDRGFSITPVPVEEDGIDVDKLPSNIRCAAYVNPSNQFPTGAVLTVGKRYKLLDWAEKNNSYIIEDDYDSELRYFGKPIPAMQGLDAHNKVIYLGSFSSTLFTAVKISYMVLPEALSRIFDKMSNDYSQTCSKTEQLALALFMEQGMYQTGIKKMRKLYSQKLQVVLQTLPDDDFITVKSANSGINILINIKSPKPASKLCQEAAQLGVHTLPCFDYTDAPGSTALIFYYNRIPLNELKQVMMDLQAKWRD